MRVFYLLITLTIFSRITQAQTDTLTITSLVQMSLNDVLNVKVFGSSAITKLTKAEAPASVTVISAEDIKHTPARNIYDLIEIYVPGAFWMNYEDGPQLGIRGNIANRNYKYLLRVNDRIMNNKGHYGVKSELEQWDLGDIERIEIVRGAGSVTYGPGAIAGIINIITADYKSAKGLKATARYVSKYDSKGFKISHGFEKKQLSVVSYASITRTKGYAANHFIGTNVAGAGYIGKAVSPDTEPLDYFADYQDNPQIKAHLDINFKEHWRFWSRYTQQGSTWRGNEAKSLFDIELHNQQGVQDRQWTNTLQYVNNINKKLSLSSMVSMDFSDVERRTDAVNIDPDHVVNKEINFGETELFFRAVANWQVSEHFELAIGTEYSRDCFGPGWGDGAKNMRIGERGHIVSDSLSNAIQPGMKTSADRFGNELFAGNGWSTDTYSFFMESNTTLSSWFKFLLSGRVDKNTYSDWLISPRISLIADIREGHHVKLIAQQSKRMSTYGQLYALNQINHQPETETLNGFELIYNAFTNKMITYSASVFMNDAQVIAWDNNIESTNLVGDLQLYGFEAEFVYKFKRGKAGLNYSYVKQISWKLADGVPSSGISYADYNQPLVGSMGVQKAVGNDLNNWYNQAVKFYGRVSLFEHLTLHADMRVLWDYQGGKDGLTGLARAVTGLPEEVAVLDAIEIVNDTGAYESDFRLNAAVDYEISKNVSIQLFSQNLVGKGGNKRYSYDFSGSFRPSPQRVRFTEEPWTWGLKLSAAF